jgi:putative transposase
MARQPRIDFPGALHHVMSHGNDGIDIVRDDTDRRFFLELLAEEIARSKWILHDYQLMKNHYHMTIETPEGTLSTGLKRFLGRYVQRFNKRHHRRGHLFEGRFKNLLVEEDTYFLEVSRYLALNPVTAGFVARPEDWQWSSYRARAGFEEAPPWLTLEPVLARFGSDVATQRKRYRKFVEAGIKKQHDVLSEAVAQMYLGSAAWIEKVQKVLDEEERSEEHPRAQVHPGRPELGDVLEAVAKTYDTTPEAIAEGRGTQQRRLVAYIAFEDGLIPLRRIAKALGVTSAGGMSNLVSRCRRELATDPNVRELVENCRKVMRRRPPPFGFPRFNPPVTARRYHRAASRPHR